MGLCWIREGARTGWDGSGWGRVRSCRKGLLGMELGAGLAGRAWSCWGGLVRPGLGCGLDLAGLDVGLVLRGAPSERMGRGPPGLEGSAVPFVQPRVARVPPGAAVSLMVISLISVYLLED